MRPTLRRIVTPVALGLLGVALGSGLAPRLADLADPTNDDVLAAPDAQANAALLSQLRLLAPRGLPRTGGDAPAAKGAGAPGDTTLQGSTPGDDGDVIRVGNPSDTGEGVVPVTTDEGIRITLSDHFDADGARLGPSGQGGDVLHRELMVENLGAALARVALRFECSASESGDACEPGSDAGRNFSLMQVRVCFDDDTVTCRTDALADFRSPLVELNPSTALDGGLRVASIDLWIDGEDIAQGATTPFRIVMDTLA